MEENKLNDEYDCNRMSKVTVGEESHDYHRGMLIFQNTNGESFLRLTGSIVRNLFLLDADLGIIYLFKTTNLSQPFKSLTLSGGTFPCTDSKYHLITSLPLIDRVAKRV